MQLVGVGCGVEVHVAGGGEVDVFAGEVGAGDVEVAVVGEAVCILGAVAGGDEGEVVAGGDVAADRDGLCAVAVGFAFAGADGDGERNDVALVGFVGGGEVGDVLVDRLSGLSGDQGSFGVVGGGECAVAACCGGVALLDCGDDAVERVADGA